jgi:hypothetical protein
MLCPISGGNWNNTTIAGVWALNLNNTRTNSNNNIGARSDLASYLTARQGGVEQRETPSCLGRNLLLAAFLVALRDGQAVAL